MGSKRRSFSNSSSISDQNFDKKLKEAIGYDNPISNSQLLNDIKDDPGKIEAMTVQQLRTALRTAGIPSKGLKRELVAALQSYLAKEIDGQSSLLEDKLDPSGSDSGTKISKMIETKSVEDQVQDVSNISKVSKVQRSRKTVKQLQIKGKTVDSEAKIVATEQKKTTCASGSTTSLTKRKAPLDVNSKDFSSKNGVTPVNQSEPWTILAHKKPQKGWIAYNPRTMRRTPSKENTKFVKILSWNVNGLRSLLKLEGFSALELAKRENFDILCLQETKLQEKDVESIKQSLIEGYENSFWTCSNAKLGYSGTAIISRSDMA